MAHIRIPSIVPAEKILRAKMDEHLSNTRIDIRTALQRFERHGVKIDRRFQRDFIKQTTDCVIDTCEHYCTKVRHRLSRKDGKSSTETVRKSHDNGKRRRSKERRPEDSQSTSKDEDTKRSSEEKTEPKKRSRSPDKQEEQKSDQNSLDSPDSKRSKIDDKHETADTTDHSNAVAEMAANDDAKTPPIIDQPQPVDQPLFFYYCAHCLGANESGDVIGGTINDVYGHWQISHIINLPSKPFEFAVAQIAVCHFGDAIGTYRELLKHQQQNHAGEHLAIVNYEDRKKCGICLKSAIESIVDHFDLEHNKISQTDIFNPLRLSECQLEKLLGIDVHQKRQCGHCDAIFETENEIDIHHSIGHESQEKISKPYNDSRSPFLICGFCQHKVERDAYFSHVRSHPYVFKCWKCSYNTNDLVNLVVHDKAAHERDTLNYHCAMFADWVRSHFYKTRIIFPNGLVLKAHNLLGTRFDESKVFEMFLDGLIDVVKSKYALLDQQQGGINGDGVVGTPKEIAMNNTPKDDGNGSAVDTVDGSGGAGCSTPCSSAGDQAFLMQELQKQNELANNLLIRQMPRTSKLEPIELFFKLCDRLGITVKVDDIVKVFRRNDCDTDFIVTMKDYQLKEEIRYAAIKKRISSGMIVDLAAGEWDKTIKVLSHTTRYYTDMLGMAREAKKLHAIVFYELTTKGIIIRRSPTSDERVFISKTELSQFFARCKRN